MSLNMMTHFSHVFMLNKYALFLTVHLLGIAQAPTCSAIAASYWLTFTVWWRESVSQCLMGPGFMQVARCFALSLLLVYFLVLFVHLADSTFQSSWKIREHDQLFKMKCSKPRRPHVQCQTKYWFDRCFSCAVGGICSHYQVLIFSWPCSSHCGEIHVLIYCCTIQNVKPMGMWSLELAGSETDFLGLKYKRDLYSFGKESVELLWSSDRIAGIWIEFFPPFFFPPSKKLIFEKLSLWTCEDLSLFFSTY